MVPQMQDALLIRSLRRQPVERTPVWVMRQAGRYLPEYRQVRALAKDFLNLCKTPKLAAEVTLQPLKRFDLDAAIVFSDILTIPDAMGLGLQFVEGEGPVFTAPLKDVDHLDTIDLPALIQRLDYVMETIQLVRALLPPNQPLIGFSGSPWTLACYMVEGASSRSFSKMLRMMYMRPNDAHKLLSWLAETTALYLSAQIQAGAQVAMIFDTWGGLLSPLNYQLFSLQYLQKIVCAIQAKHPAIPIVLFTKGVGINLSALAALGADAIGVDWTMDLHLARQLVGKTCALQGNLDPAVLLTDPATIETEVKRVLASFGKGSGHVFNLGHGITPEVPPEHLNVMIEAVHRWSPEYHAS
jgi:uroporphyrinogen decarboxylase